MNNETLLGYRITIWHEQDRWHGVLRGSDYRLEARGIDTPHEVVERLLYLWRRAAYGDHAITHATRLRADEM